MLYYGICVALVKSVRATNRIALCVVLKSQMDL